MLLKRNLLESVTIISCCASFICILLHYLTNISPISGIWFPLYILLIFFLSVLFSFKFIQWLLRLNKPIKYDFEGLVTSYPFLSLLEKYLPQTQMKKKRKLNECKEYDTNELSVISTVLERKLVSSWYMHYVSQEISFPFACKQMLDQMICKAFQICNKIETKDIFVDICSILISHLKEYRKALKRHEKCPENPIETHYKKSHPIFQDGETKCQSADHCTNILRIILKELVPWELWDTPHSELLVRILSKKLDNFIDTTLSDPVWLNDKLLSVLDEKVSQEVKAETVDKEETKEPQKLETTTVETALSSVITKTTAPILHRPLNGDEDSNHLVENINSIVEEVDINRSEPVDIKTSPILRQRRGRQGRNEVKIYDRIIEGSIKTWDTDIDLQCISLGQDLLASLDGEITLSRLWGQEVEPDGSPNPPKRKSPQPLWFGEEDAIDLELAGVSPKELSPVKKELSPIKKELSPVKKELSPKPTDVLLKDIQSTVNQAKNKIGDLQVTKTHVDVPKRLSGDEAAGMMEGLLDFGIAGLKKGLRFTGLSDDAQDKSPSNKDRMPSPEIEKCKPVTVDIPSATSNAAAQRDDNTSAHLLMKQHRITSQDSVPSPSRPVVHSEPAMGMPDSPEPEYEEAADLSTSIAKLRSLLQQRAEHDHSNADIWWEGAEETRGRAHRRPSSRPVDTATLADEYDMNADRGTSPEHTTNNMQRLDKLFQRTVGVINSIRTAVGGEEEGAALLGLGAPTWKYVCAPTEGTAGAVGRLLGARRANAHVDAALDSLSALTAPPSGYKAPPDAPPEDLEEWCASRGAVWCACAEVCAAAGLARSHLTQRLAALLLADIGESVISNWVEDVGERIREQVFECFKQMSEEEAASSTLKDLKERASLKEFRLEDTCDVIFQRLPVLYIFGEESGRAAIGVCVRSLTHRVLNKELVYRVLDTLAVHYKRAAALKSPSFDHNL